MTRNYYYFYLAIGAIVIITAYSLVSMFATLGNHQQPANAINKVEYNSTSTICIDYKPCVTTICINNEPCHTITSNSTNTDNSTNKKHTIVAPFPQENV